MQYFLEHLALLELVRVVDERNYDYIIRTGFWKKRKGETNGQTNEWRSEWRLEERKKKNSE